MKYFAIAFGAIVMIISVAIIFFTPEGGIEVYTDLEKENVDIGTVESQYSNEDEEDIQIEQNITERVAETIVENLIIPWEVVFLPNGNLLISERNGKLVEFNRETGDRVSINLDDVRHTGEGGLLGIALHPEFVTNRYMYVYRTSSLDGKSQNSVLRYVYEDQLLTDEFVIVDNIPGSLFHNGGRIAFGPDGLLYIATGDAQNPSSSQSTDSLAGKILRVTDDGGIPEGNPFGNEVYSYGHRNPQGLTWDSNGVLWSTEHGRSGIRSGLDELNVIIKGGNYGWPESQGDTVLRGTIGPIIHSGPDVTWAPGSAVYKDGSIFFGGLKGETLYEAKIVDLSVSELKTHFVREYGRIRTVVMGPDGWLYIMTSNRDGRGQVRSGDDRIVRVMLP